MYAAAFDYVRASSWAEAVEQLQQLGDEAHVIAGGQSLVPMTLPMWRTAWVSIGTCSATTAESASRCPR
jgi:CO/xanthine dehydrogenase FAD-binding subunit